MIDKRPPSLSCPLCESRSTFPLSGYQNIGAGNWALRRCRHCRTAFLYPCPPQEILAQYYDEAYYGRGDGKFLSPVEGVVRIFRLLRAKSVKNVTPSGRVLDVGCGRGMMLSYLKKWGFEVDGVELDTLAATRAQKNLGQSVFHSLDELCRSSRKPYQVISFWHSLEHMPEPGKTLHTAHELLAPGGILIIAAPHTGSIQSRMAGPFWLHLDLPRHLVQFDMERLSDWLQAKGYVLLRHDHFSLEYNPIDTLCHLYRLIGYPPLFPFDMIRNVRQSALETSHSSWLRILGLVFFAPLAALGFLLANFYSIVRSGSTTTLYLRKQCRPSSRGARAATQASEV